MTTLGPLDAITDEMKAIYPAKRALAELLNAAKAIRREHVCSNAGYWWYRAEAACAAEPKKLNPASWHPPSPRIPNTLAAAPSLPVIESGI